MMPEHDRIGTFTVDATGHLVRRCHPRSGKEYEHRCRFTTLEEVAHTIDELDGAPFTYEEIHAAMNTVPGVPGVPGGPGAEADVDYPFTQVAVAIAFLKERGIIVPVRGRRHIANGGAVHLDTMIEFHALRETDYRTG